MATATRRTAGALDGATTKPESEPAAGSLRVEVFQENSGRHSWNLTTSDGIKLARSCGSFASRDDAVRAAAHVRGLSAAAEA